MANRDDVSPRWQELLFILLAGIVLLVFSVLAPVDEWLKEVTLGLSIVGISAFICASIWVWW